MPDMQQIEPAIGERNPFPGAPPFFDAFAKLFAGQGFLVCIQISPVQ
jgi:hypothetical protein